MGVHSLFLVAVLATCVISVPHERRTDAVASASKFDYFGVNESGPEFGEKQFPGIKDKHVRAKAAVIDWH
jgi:endoglucanase